ncbi:hypothetical protein [Mesorhizobium sp.]|uniref:hypothetical protein n=1 Tax=Mesorhizobium sp. TaxID=1871066 RepID=UPI00121FD8E9|nr:hypothetical protein [Mesorhizobium sp.]TIS55771.1 MAG: hypothetical protein E5W91_20430 [Mesorhizobium sp.]TIS89833.1 MAG: hypothetical protein E5W89_15190 [Mesorhizobium sp.]
MIVSGFKAEEDVARAEVRWEEAGRDTQEISVQGHDLYADPNAFLILCFLPAWHAGERRIVIEGGGICPVLRANLAAASQTLTRWHRLADPPRIEASTETRWPGEGVGLFVSGGIDSLASLRSNLQAIPRSHPEAVSAAILVGGNTSERKFMRLREVHEILAHEAGVQAVVLRTNAQSLHNNNMSFYINIYHGAFLAGLAHFVGGRLRKVKISATFDAANLEPWGSHPLLDPFYSSAHMAIEHHGLEMSRLAKTAIVADWPVALDHVKVCGSLESVGENCGRCEKCLRTMLALIALGKLNTTAAFPQRDLRAEDLTNLKIDNAYQASCYRDLLLPLRDRGRSDLAAVLERKLAPPTRLSRLVRKARTTLGPANRLFKAAIPR